MPAPRSKSLRCRQHLLTMLSGHAWRHASRRPKMGHACRPQKKVWLILMFEKDPFSADITPWLSGPGMQHVGARNALRRGRLHTIKTSPKKAQTHRKPARRGTDCTNPLNNGMPTNTSGRLAVCEQLSSQTCSRHCTSCRGSRPRPGIGRRSSVAPQLKLGASRSSQTRKWPAPEQA